MTIHSENPFATPPGEREPARRLRGRLVAPVTILTAGLPDAPAGLTVSSILVAEGEVPAVLALVGDATDFWYALSETGRFVVHVCESDRRMLADRFAGIVPAPGGLFAGMEVIDGEHGPELVDIPNRARCSLVDAPEVGWHRLVRGAIDSVELGDVDPLAWFRGRYWKIGEGGG